MSEESRQIILTDDELVGIIQDNHRDKRVILNAIAHARSASARNRDIIIESFPSCRA